MEEGLHPAALLKWYVDQGLDETIGEEAIDRFAAVTQQPAPAVTPAAPAAPTPFRPAAPSPAAAPRAPVPLESPQVVEDAPPSPIWRRRSAASKAAR
jgi:hypothetical protein